MALQWIQAASVTATTIAIPSSHEKGDLLLMFAFRNGSTTAPTIPTGWTQVGINTGTLCSSAVAYKVATTSSETSGTWTNASGLVCHVYRGQFTSGTPVVNSGAQTGTGTTVNYAGIVTMTDPGRSFVARFAGIANTNSAIYTAPSGYHTTSNISADGVGVAGFDTLAPVSSSSFAAVSVGGTSANYITKTIEILADTSVVGLTAKTNQLTGPATATTSTTTDPDLQPKAIMLWHGLQTAPGAIADAQFSLGVASSSTTETAAGYNSDDGVATSDVVRYFNTARLGVNLTAGTTTVNNLVELTSFNPQGFTLNWPTLTTANPIYNYLVLGGKDITDVKTGSFALNTSTGNQAVTGIGFQPDIVFLFFTLQTTSAQSNNTSQYGFGVMHSSGSQWAMTQRAQNSTAVMSTNRAFSSSACMIMTQTAANNIAHLASFVSMDADGFTINNQTSVGLACLTGYMAIKGGSWKVGTDTQKTSTGTKATTGIGFMPKGVIFGSVCDTPTDGSVTTNARLTIGATTGTANNVSLWTGDQNGAADAIANTIMSNSKCIVMATEGTSATPTVNAEAALSSFDADGFTLNWTTADATARSFGYVAFADSPPTSFYYFDGHNGVSDPNNVWADDTLSFNNDSTDGASTSTSGTKTTNYLQGNGTNAPGTGTAITRVRVRHRGANGELAEQPTQATYYSSSDEELGTSIAHGGHFTGREYSDWTTLSVPSGGWTWQKVKDLYVRFYAESVVADASNYAEALVAEVEVAAPVAAIDTVADNFNDNTINADIWQPFYDIAIIEETNQQLQITIPSGTVEYAAFSTAVGYNLTSSYIYIQLVDAGDQSLNSLEVYPLYLLDADSNGFFIFLNLNGVYAVKNVGTVNSTVGSLTYNPSVHKWFRIREAGGTVYYDYSTDGTSWTNFASVASTGINTAAMALFIYVGTWKSEATSATAILDNVNTTATVVAANFNYLSLTLGVG